MLFSLGGFGRPALRAGLLAMAVIGAGGVSLAVRKTAVTPGVATFAPARPGYRWSFPRDLGMHPGYRTEWWYYTGHLLASGGRAYGYELTLFRVGLRPPGPARSRSRWAMNDLYLGHFAVTDIHRQRFRYDERAARGALGLAGASTGTLNTWCGRWRVRSEGPAQRLFADQPEYAIDLRAIPVHGPVLHGRAGYSQKGSGAEHASQYFSFTRLATEGRLRTDGRWVSVRGTSWMDHEFSSGSLAPDEAGWDWFSLQLSTGDDVMLYRMRRRNGSIDPHSGGTWVSANGIGATIASPETQVTATSHWRSPHSGIDYPSAWTIDVPSRGLSVRLSPVLADQELRTGRSTGVTYWEGAVQIDGTLHGRPVHGDGYVELTGYGGSIAPKA